MMVSQVCNRATFHQLQRGLKPPDSCLTEDFDFPIDPCLSPVYSSQTYGSSRCRFHGDACVAFFRNGCTPCHGSKGGYVKRPDHPGINIGPAASRALADSFSLAATSV